MRFYSGFCLQDESGFFSHIIEENDLYLYGFSYGAIKAFKAVKAEVESGKRVDKLILLSPAFFQTKPKSFKRLQLKAFSSNANRYLQNFLGSCFAPYEKADVQTKLDTIEDLQTLLEYEWSLSELQELKEKGVRIEVYIGEKDRVIDAKGAFEFFTQVADVTYIKSGNHFLQGE